MSKSVVVQIRYILKFFVRARLSEQHQIESKLYSQLPEADNNYDESIGVAAAIFL